MEFKKAVRRSAKARLALSGPSGSGKTWSALLVAGGLGGSVALIDTEKGSASLYAGLPGIPEFDVLELGAPYSPERFIEAMQSAAKAAYDIVIIDGDVLDAMRSAEPARAPPHAPSAPVPP